MALARDLEISGGLLLPAHLFTVRTSRSGGPGGQRVNKVETKVDLRLDLNGATSVLGNEVVARIRARLASRLDRQGKLQVISSVHRDQERNVAASYARIKRLIEGAMTARKRRRPTRPTPASRKRRLDEKKRRGQIKKWRAARDD